MREGQCVWPSPAKCSKSLTRRIVSRKSTSQGFAGTSTSDFSTTIHRGGIEVGDWVLIHVGFALSKVDEEEAIATRKMLEGMGDGLRAGTRGAKGKRDRVTFAPQPQGDHAGHAGACGVGEEGCITCGDVALPLRVESVDHRARAGALHERGGPVRDGRDRARRRRGRRATSSSSTPGTAIAHLGVPA